MTPARSSGIAMIVVGIAGFAWFVFELMPPLLGYGDTDDAVVMLGLLRDHPWVYSAGGVCLLVMAGALIPAALGIARVISCREPGLAGSTSAVVGCIAAGFFALQGVLRLGGGPLLHIAGLDRDQGLAGYTAVQLLGVQGAMQLAVIALCCWALLVAFIGGRNGSIARWIAWSAVIPGLRLVLLLLGPFVVLPDALWIVAMATIPGTFVWCIALGVTLLRSERTHTTLTA